MGSNMTQRPLTEDEKGELSRKFECFISAAIKARRIWLDAKMNEACTETDGTTKRLDRGRSKMETTNGEGFGLYRAPEDDGPLGGIIHTSGHYYKGDLIQNPDGSREFKPYPDDDPRHGWNRYTASNDG